MTVKTRKKSVACWHCRRRYVPRGRSIAQNCPHCGEPTGSRRAKQSEIVGLADGLFSVLVRRGAADEYGYVNCVTCRKRKAWEDVDCGHFRSRGSWVTRYWEENTAPQCKRCNGPRSGMQHRFGLEIDLRWGDGTAERVMAAPESKLTRQELLSLAKMLWIDLCEAGYEGDAERILGRYRAAALEAGIVI